MLDLLLRMILKEFTFLQRFSPLIKCSGIGYLEKYFNLCLLFLVDLLFSLVNILNIFIFYISLVIIPFKTILVRKEPQPLSSYFG